MIKKKKLLFLFLTMSVLNVSQVYAGYGFATGTSGAYSSDGGTAGGNVQESGWKDEKIGNRKLQYRFRFRSSSSSTLNIEEDSPSGDVIKAGTWMGIQALESQYASWDVLSIEYKEIKKVYSCTIYEKNCKIETKKVDIPDGNGNYKKIDVMTSTCNPYNRPLYEGVERNYYDEKPSCMGNLKTDEKEVAAGEEGSIKQKVYALAHDYAASKVGSPMSIIYIETDDAGKIEIKGKLINGSDSGNVASGSISKTYSYKPNNICINLKTGKVKYNKECQQDEEVKINPYISNGREYWQYFSQLDMKTGSNLSLIIKGNNDRELSADECRRAMDNYKNEYQNRIISKNGKKLKGDYCKNSSCTSVNTGYGSDWQEVSNGCYHNASLNYYVIQKYYYEEMKNNQLRFNGYNIYYRPININNPFPTTPTANSLWYEWYNSTNKTPNLKESFNEKTYSVSVSHKLADTIRKYNVNNPYPSFDKLSLNGKSQFLQSIGAEPLTNDSITMLGKGTKTCINGKTISIGSDCS